MSLKEKFSAAKKGVKKGLSKAFNSRTYRAAWIGFDFACVGFFGVATLASGGIAAPLLFGALAVLSAFNASADVELFKKVNAQKKLQKKSAGPQQ